MAKRSTSAALVVVVVMLWLALCFAEDKAEDGTLKDIKEKSKSWGNWASDNFSEGLDRFSRESHEAKKPRDVIETVGEAASTATEMMNSAGFGTSKYAFSKAGKALSEAKEFGSFGLDKAKDA
ncbi:hypothetical protein L484_014589 [Morus notabilis]|uniref:Uncharacterized protein n=1 Tax=Morus notabilis TaxID=981085 RepID=W9QYE0_9ROSA|nr:uncharacterized protein LOC21397723 isoform X2 [Morus notabilis]EXB59095.1 hypothetical protein L484_014589 [Morus notabilis]